MQLLAGSVHIPDSTTAILWDMDGVLIDSLGLDVAICGPLFSRHFGVDVTVSRALVCKHFALDPMTYFEVLLAELLPHYPQAASTIRADKIAEDYLAVRNHTVFSLLPAVPALVAAAKQRGLKQAVVSNNSTADLPLILAQAGLDNQFDLIIGNDLPDEQGHMLHKKPAPDFYLYACRQLGITPQQAVVMEDSVLGATAGIEAGAHVIAVLTGSNMAAEFHAMAKPPHQIYPDFSQLPLHYGA